MANFTDNPQLLTNFNPYVQQLPVDAMREVGMYKQAKYDEGVQKIQTAIDNIAGLDVVRDVDKNYLQTKLNEIGNKVTSVAAGDFSNFQLVNSTAGMISKFAKDTIVQNAVMSTAKYRKGLSEMEQAKKEGKSSPSNDYVFNKEASDWLFNKDINSKFSGSYTTYTAHQKEALEVIKGLVKNENITDVALSYDKNGNVDGVLDATTRTKIAGITPERIQQALLVGLSPAAFKQLEIDGRYNYANKTAEEFVNDISSSYNNDKNELNKLKQFLTNSLDSSKSISKKDEINQQIQSIDRQLHNVEKDYSTVSKLIENGNIEGAKAQLHTTKWMNNFAQTFSHSEVSQTYETNAFQQPLQFREQQKQDWSKFVLNQEQQERFHADEVKFKELSYRLAVKTEEREAKKDELEAMYGSVPVTVDQKGLKDVSIEKVISHVNDQQAYLNAEKSALMKSYNVTDDKWLEQQELAWKSGGLKDPVLQDYFQKTSRIEADMGANKAMLLDINKQANANFKMNIPKDSKSLIVTTNNGKTIYSPEEIANFNNKFKKYIHTITPRGGVNEIDAVGVSRSTYDDVSAKKELSPKEMFLYNIYKKHSMSKPLSSSEKSIMGYSSNIRKNVNIPYAKTLKEKNSWIQQQIKDRIMTMEGTASSVPLSTAFQKTSFGNALLGFADNADKPGGLPNSPGVTAESIRAIAADIKNATFTEVEGTTFQPAMYEVNATNSKGESVKFRVTPEQKDRIFGNRFDASPEVLAARPYINQMFRAGGNTTAVDGKRTNLANSFLTRVDFPNVKNYGVSGNIIKTGGKYSVRLNMIDPKTKKVIVTDLPYPSSGLIDEGKIVPALQNLSDAAIFEMINNRVPSVKDLERLKED